MCYSIHCKPIMLVLIFIFILQLIACGGESKNADLTNQCLTNTNGPEIAMDYGFVNFNSRNFEIYSVDLNHKGYWPAIQAWHDFLERSLQEWISNRIAIRYSAQITTGFQWIWNVSCQQINDCRFDAGNLFDGYKKAHDEALVDFVEVYQQDVLNSNLLDDVMSGYQLFDN